MFNVEHIDHLVLRVVNTEAMLDFYINVLGCRLEKVQEELGLYQVRAGSCLIDLVPVDGQLGKLGGAAPGLQGRNLDHFCLRIDPFNPDDIFQYLDGKGIEHGNVESRYGAEGE